MSTTVSTPSPTSPAPSTSSTPELPWAFIACPSDTLVILISHMLELLIRHNDQVVLTPDALTRFHSRAAPGISVVEYLRRIVKYTNMEKIPLLSLLAYIDITCTNLPTFTLSSLTVHRFLIAGVCAGSKAQCDVFCTNSHYAKVGGIKVQELNALEREFLKVTKWDVNCKSELLQRYYSSLIKSHGGYTQAPEPASSPFRSFPRSVSKPRGPAPDTQDEEMGAPDEEGYGDGDADREDGDEDDEDEGMSSNDTSRRESATASYNSTGPGPTVASGVEEAALSGNHASSSTAGSMAIDPGNVAGTNSSPGPNKRGRRRKSSVDPNSPAPLRTGAGTQSIPMDIDEAEKMSNGTVVGNRKEETKSLSHRLSPTSPASSSIPSSRSSLRGRNVSYPNPSPTLAEPKIDLSTAQGDGWRAGGGGVVGNGTTAQAGTSSSANQPVSQVDRTPPIPIPNFRSESSSREVPSRAGRSLGNRDTAPSDSQSPPHGHSHPHHGFGHGRSLKSLVGGLFKRDHHQNQSHHNDTHQHDQSQLPSQAETQSSSVDFAKQPQPNQPPPTSLSSTSSYNSSANQPSQAQAQAQAQPQSIAKSPIISSHPIGTSGLIPPDLSRPITPRVRGRDERSADSIADAGGSRGRGRGVGVGVGVGVGE